ncbi:Restriction enzyme BgcI subunit alpha [Thermincola ferriacetica]|uniref:site-specific DNA-methyltransferase (adenine-specific) n=1 Tax=Thermincola ferriacetica TaxID=281456 RepID=A0A0L6VZM0_9FIRM|nr:N-6 DNA methylase [Thermincola ferriacetica]KNZ68656.1 Restriction enzyme BgcI subunit alpha [Thermincola ferriacetica]
MEKRNTEYFVRKMLEQKGYKHPNEANQDDPVFEEQKSEKHKIAERLSKASKNGTGAPGEPEFICSKMNSDIVIVIECKKELSKLKSSDFSNQSNIKNYAVDGSLWYGKFLSDVFHVFCIGVAGTQENNLDIETYYIAKGSKKHEFFGTEILSFADYEAFLKEEELRETIDEEKLKKIANELNNLMRDEFKLSEDQKPLLISAIFLALKDGNFRASYRNMQNSLGLATLIDTTVSNMILKDEIEQTKRNALLSKYAFLRTTTRLISETHWDVNDIRPETAPLLYMVNKLESECFRFIENNETTLDIIGIFYSNFLKYTSSDGKGLGIVLTPQHITELFCNLANDGRGLDPEKDIVLDPCAGTGGFLVSAMHQMITKAKNNHTIIEDIKKNRIRGIESNDKMFALLSANMIVRGDGRSGIQYGDCFDQAIKQKVISKGKPTVGFMNPPYSQKKSDESEYHFIENMLDLLEQGGSGIVIVPLSKACSLQKQDVEYKKSILKKHTLKAVMKMNVQLFGENASSHTCIMVFEAHRPHQKQVSPVWLANWSDDGFEVLMHRGRVMVRDWKEIQNQWLKDFRTKIVKPGYSTIAYLDENDEWIVDAHIETDYSNLTINDFVQNIQNYLAFQIQYPLLFGGEEVNE